MLTPDQRAKVTEDMKIALAEIVRHEIDFNALTMSGPAKIKVSTQAKINQYAREMPDYIDHLIAENDDVLSFLTARVDNTLPDNVIAIENTKGEVMFFTLSGTTPLGDESEGE